MSRPRSSQNGDRRSAMAAAGPNLSAAGGQSLMPVLAFRLAVPSLQVDLRRVSGLGNIAVGQSGVRLGARVRWRDIEHDRWLATGHPLLREAVAHVTQPSLTYWLTGFESSA